MSKKPFTYAEFKAIYSKVPRLAAEVIIKSDSGILLAKRAIPPYKGFWHLPGGTVYHKEYLEDSIKRVAKDEVGIEVNIDKFLGFIYYTDLEEEQKWNWVIGAAFLTTMNSGETRGSNQGEEIKFFKKLPEKIVASQGEFLLAHRLLLK